MKHKDGDKSKSTTCPSSAKGRRKLEFEKKNKQLPLSGKIIYLDVKDVRQVKSLEGKVKTLGAVVEKFLIKDVNYVISSNAPTSRQKKGAQDPGTADSPAFQNTPSPFNMGQSPSPGAVETKKETVTRGKAILQIAKNKSSHTNVIDAAQKMGIKIVGLDAAIKWIEKELLKVKTSQSSASTTSKQIPKKKSSFRVQKLKNPYVKFEAASCHYRPIMQQLDTWPRINTETAVGTCPFDGRALGKPQNSERGDREEGAGENIMSPGTPQAQRDDLSGTPGPQTKSQSKTTKLEENSNCRLFGVPIITAGDIKREKEKRKREAKRKGYCECCKEKFEDIDKHIRGQTHKNFVRNKKNFDCLDCLINQGSNTVSFLQSVLFKHCMQKAATKPNAKQIGVDGIGMTKTKNPKQKRSPDLPPEQLRVGRKIIRKHKHDRKPDFSAPVVRIEKINVSEMCQNKVGAGNQQEKCEKPSPMVCTASSHQASESTAAVVIRRSASRGVYGSPKRPSSSRSEKTLVIRDSPIASLQPLKEFLKKHSTKQTDKNAKKDLDRRKRKSSPTKECSPLKIKRPRMSREEGIQEVERETKAVEIKDDQQSNNGLKMKTSHKERNGIDVSPVKKTPKKLSQNRKDNVRDLESPIKLSEDLASLRKSSRLQCFQNSQAEEREGVDVVSNCELKDAGPSKVHKGLRTPRKHDAENAGPSKVYQGLRTPRKHATEDEHPVLMDQASPRRQSRHRNSKSDNAETLKPEPVSANLGDLSKVAVSLCTRSRSPQKRQKMNSETPDIDICEGKSSELATPMSKRRCWKKQVLTASAVKRGKRLKRLDETCSEISNVSEISSQKVETPRKSLMNMCDSSSPTFKRQSRRSQNIETESAHTNDISSPVFKRRVKKSFTSSSQEINVSQYQLQGQRTPKSKRSQNSHVDYDVNSPKSGLSATPKRQKSRRSIVEDLLNTLCEHGESKEDSEEMEKTRAILEQCLSPRRSRRNLALSPKRVVLSPNKSNISSPSKSQKGKLENDPAPKRSSSNPNKTRASSPSKLQSRQKSLEGSHTLKEIMLASKSPTRSQGRRSRSADVTPRAVELVDYLAVRTTRSKDQGKAETANSANLHEHKAVAELKTDPSKSEGKAKSSDKVSSPTKSHVESFEPSPKKTPTSSKRKWRKTSTNMSASKTVKLNRSWLVLSERSMSKLLESEADEEPFLGFTKEASDSQLPSDLTYEEVSEIDVSEDSNREWVIEEDQDNMFDDYEVETLDDEVETLDDEVETLDDDEVETLDDTLIQGSSLIQKFFPSPDKASNSSWGDACDSFLQVSCERRLQGKLCSTPLLTSPINRQSPRHKKLTIASPERYVERRYTTTPKKGRKVSRRNLNDETEMADDREIVFNFNYQSPKRKRSESLQTSVGQSVGNGAKPLRLLKKASDVKKTFNFSYGMNPIRSPKTKRKVEIDSRTTVIMVGPKPKK